MSPLDDQNHEQQPDLTIRQKLSELYSLAREDMAQTNLSGKVAIIGLIAMGGYEWTVGNEVVTPFLASQALEISNGLGGVAVTTLIAGGFTYLQQRASGYLARRTSKQFPKVAEKSFSYVSDEEGASKNTPFQELPNRDKLKSSFFVGTSYNVLRERFLVGQSDPTELLSIDRRSAAIASLAVCSLGAALDVTDQQTQNVGWFQFMLDWTIKYPLMWMGVGGYMAYKYAKK